MAAVLACFGLIVGSFLNVVIYRLPLMMQRDWRAQCHEFLELPAPADSDGSFAKCSFKANTWNASDHVV